jgi:hypothetical protein
MAAPRARPLVTANHAPISFAPARPPGRLAFAVRCARARRPLTPGEAEALVNIAVHIEPAQGSPAEVEYRWDTDTDILTAQLRQGRAAGGMSGSVDLEGSDGSWLILDVAGGHIHGVEVAVWPTVRKRADLSPPPEVEDATVRVSNNSDGARVTAVEVNTSMAAEADHAERTIHFKLGPPRSTRTVRIGRDLLLDIDGRNRLAGVWLLDVPPFPGQA